jgi:enolase-phosphatase E1
VIRALVTDIEGTTTSISFVKDLLFPYSRARIADFVSEHAREPEIRILLDRLRDRTSNGTDREIIDLLHTYIDEDRKDPVLKDLQGRIWRHGYESSAFVSHLYPDVVPALRRWKERGIALYVFSSGSVEAQRLLFGHSQAGDLTPLFSGWFDTRAGKKTDPEAYRAIAMAIGTPASDIAFLSDVRGELDAAKAAGFSTYGVDREPGTDVGDHPRVTSFDQLSIERS